MEFANFKITFISSRLFRIQKQSYTNENTQVIINRNNYNEFKLTYRKHKKNHIFTTNDIKVKTDENGNVLYVLFLSSNKKVKDYYSFNLKGTARTLDGINGSISLSDGLIAKNGVAILDDSKSLILKNNKLIKRKKCSDLYYFCFENNYQEALNQYYHLTGKVPLIPRYALGNWWSRYHAYSDEEYLELINQFKKHNIPINVSVIDMDWHYVDIIKEFYDENIPTSNLQYYDGWTGYSWNTQLFKDYKEFLKTLKNDNLKVTLNLHPAQGVRKYEVMFNEFAKSMNIDPTSTNIIEFDISNDKFMKSYFEVLHHPYEKDGVDFWWIDWQQGTSSKVKNLDPLWALNHYHYLDNDKSNTRPMILSRYSGPGSHRYPLGFSGDTHMTWKSLDFQPYFTNCATNIGYVWWSHDIGGHCCGYKDNELYIRWLQYGVFSPINRLHSTNDPFTGKEPWKLPSQYKDIAIKYLQFRKRLIPYLYSMNYQTYKNNIALIRPLYYMINNELAYKFKNEYFFGSELLVSPITSKSNKITCLSKVKTYIPKGRWTDIFTNQIYNVEQELTLYRDISYIPVLAKQGAIIPLYVDYQSNNIDNNQDLEILIYKGNNSLCLYEDDGESKDYLSNKYSLKEMIIKEEENTISFTIKANRNKEYDVTYNRYFYLSFKDVIKGDVSCNVPFEIINNDFLQIKVKDDNIDIVITIKNCKFLTNKNKKEALIDLISLYQMDNFKRADKFIEVIRNDNISFDKDDDYYGPLNEIIKAYK